MNWFLGGFSNIGQGEEDQSRQCTLVTNTIRQCRVANTSKSKESIKIEPHKGAIYGRINLKFPSITNGDNLVTCCAGLEPGGTANKGDE